MSERRNVHVDPMWRPRKEVELEGLRTGQWCRKVCGPQTPVLICTVRLITGVLSKNLLKAFLKVNLGVMAAK